MEMIFIIGIVRAWMVQVDGCAHGSQAIVGKQPVVVVRVVNDALLAFTSGPVKRRMTLRTPHLLTTGNLKDACATTRAGPCRLS